MKFTHMKRTFRAFLLLLSSLVAWAVGGLSGVSPGTAEATKLTEEGPRSFLKNELNSNLADPGT